MSTHLNIALEFINVTKSFAKRKSDSNSKNLDETQNVVDHLSFHVNDGEFFSILGPSGCGKTTCLRMISGLEKPTSGTIQMSGVVVNNIHPHQRNVHMMFQKYALFPHLNVFENVAFALRVRKKSEKEIKDKVTRMLKMVKMLDYGKRMINELSGGEQQRIALIRSLINEPKILLLDEPLGALDLKLREQMQLELVALQRQLGTTFIFVTHDQWEALTLSDRVAIMNHGKIEQIGTPNEVYEDPKTAFVSRFVGTTNLFKGKVSSIRERLVSIQTDSGAVLHSFVQPNRNIPQLGQNVGMIVRPEKIRLRTTAPTNSSPVSTVNSTNGLETITTESIISFNTIRGQLMDRTYFGATTQIRVQVASLENPLLVLLANQSASKMPSLKPGEKYYAVWDTLDCVLVEDV